MIFRTTTALALFLALPIVAVAETVNESLRPDPGGAYDYTPPETASDGVYEIEIRDGQGNLYARARSTAPRLGDGHMVGAYELFHPSGALRERVPLDGEGLLHGEARSWDEAGNLAAVTPYEHGRKQGTETWYWDNGGIRRAMTWAAGTLHGPWRSFYRNGQVEVDDPYAKGRLDGVERKYHENGVLASEVQWSAGKRDGPFRNYDSDGNLTGEGRYVDGRADGRMLEYWPSGEPRSERHFDAGVPVGAAKRWSEDGELIERTDHADDGSLLRERRWRDGRRTYLREPVMVEGHGPGEKIVESQGNRVETEIRAGDYFLFTRELDGELFDRSEMVGGEYTGLFVATGNIDGERTRVHFVEGEEQGLFTVTWHGETLERGHYDRGRRVGDWQRVEQYGQVIHETYDEAGTLHGERRVVTRCCGKLVRLETFDHGTLNGPYKELRDGTLVNGGSYAGGMKTGLWTETEPYRSEVWTGRYEAGRRTGTWTLADAEGYRIEVADYAADDRDGPRYLLAPDGALEEVQMWRGGRREGYTTYHAEDGTVAHELWRDGMLEMPAGSFAEPEPSRP